MQSWVGGAMHSSQVSRSGCTPDCPQCAIAFCTSKPAREQQHAKPYVHAPKQNVLVHLMWYAPLTCASGLWLAAAKPVSHEVCLPAKCCMCRCWHGGMQCGCRRVGPSTGQACQCAHAIKVRARELFAGVHARANVHSGHEQPLGPHHLQTPVLWQEAVVA